MIISVIGSNQTTPEIYHLAEQVGIELAKRNAIVVCGGLGGVIEAVCKGAKSYRGITVGILPGNNPNAANEWVDIPICTGLGYSRNAIVVKSGRSVIAVEGAYGTLSEIGHALSDGIPVIGLCTWTLSRHEKKDSSILIANSPVDAVAKALKAARGYVSMVSLKTNDIN